MWINHLLRELGVSGSSATARRVCRRDARPAREQDEWARLVRDWFPELVDTRLRQVTWPTIEVHRDYIAEQLKAGVTASTVHQRLRDEHGLTSARSRDPGAFAPVHRANARMPRPLGRGILDRLLERETGFHDQ
jgi:hypothetical protein